MLASASPRRHALLRDAGFSFHARAPRVDESVVDGEGAAQYVARLAAAKARDVARRFAGDGADAIVGADTCVAVDGVILGKPAGRTAAAAMLRRLSAREHRVFTGVHAIAAGREAAKVCATTVRFTALSDADISRHLGHGEFTDKAGAYAIQGRAAPLIAEVRGSYTNVIGLPLAELREALAEVMR
ncbi:MAG: Maf family protein [Gammaproteobacteria bacterium]|nr:Maf family protein [Gammaproteobacteria bacterium]